MAANKRVDKRDAPTSSTQVMRSGGGRVKKMSSAGLSGKARGSFLKIKTRTAPAASPKRQQAVSTPVSTPAPKPAPESEFPDTREMKITEARSSLADIVRGASMLDEATVITQNGKPAAVVIGIDEYKEFVAARDARLAARIRENAKSATWVTHDEVLAQFAEMRKARIGDTAD